MKVSIREEPQIVPIEYQAMVVVVPLQ